MSDNREERDSRGYFEGYTGRNCGEHRTVGNHRAWCYDCTEWCYPGGSDNACSGCAASILAAELAETRAALDRARDIAALLESELTGAIRPQVLTTETPEPAGPWRVVAADPEDALDISSEYWAWAPNADYDETAVTEAAGRPVYVISGQAVNDRG